MPSAEPPSEQQEPTPAERLRLEQVRVARHEAAHVVMYWNLGFGVRTAFIHREECFGSARALRGPKRRGEGVARAVCSIAGMATHRDPERGFCWTDLSRCRTDLVSCVGWFLTPEERAGLADGEQFGVGLILGRRVSLLLQCAELKVQVGCLARDLLADGRIFQAQVAARLKALPESPIARRKCRELVAELEQEREQILRRAAGYEPEFTWSALEPGERPSSQA